jgi:hypothetical protein
MPCILCKNDAKVTERILLDDLSNKSKQFYEDSNFVNWEFDYICVPCYRKDSFRRLRGNAIGLFLTTFIRFAMIFITSLAAWSFMVKFKYTGPSLFWAPVIFSTLCTLCIYRLFLKIIMGVTFVVSAALILIYSAAYSNSASFLPNLGAVVDRQRLKQDGYSPVSSDRMNQSTGTSNSGSSKPLVLDPVEISRKNEAQAREANLKSYLESLEKYTPFHLRIGLKEVEANLPRTLYGFGILYAILIPWYFLGMPIIRWWRERNKKRKSR